MLIAYDTRKPRLDDFANKEEKHLKLIFNDANTSHFLTIQNTETWFIGILPVKGDVVVSMLVINQLLMTRITVF